MVQGGHNSLKSLNLLEKFQSPWISLKLLEKLKKWPFLLENSLKIFLYSWYFPLIKIFNKILNSNILMHFQLGVSENVSRAEKVYEVKFILIGIKMQNQTKLQIFTTLNFMIWEDIKSQVSRVKSLHLYDWRTITYFMQQAKIKWSRKGRKS